MIFEVTMFETPAQGNIRFRAVVRAESEKEAIQNLVNGLSRQGYINGHMTGYPADLFTVTEILEERAVYLIEING